MSELKNEGEFQNTRERIIYEAGKLMRKKGFSATSMQEIALEVGMLKGSLYHHFTSKEEILFSVVCKGINKLIQDSQPAFESELPPPAKLRKLIHIHAEHLMNNNDSIVVFSQEKDKLSSEYYDVYIQKRNQLEMFLRDTIGKGVKEGYFPTELDVKLTTFCILGMINWLIQWYHPEGTKSPHEIAKYMEFLICDQMMKK